MAQARASGGTDPSAVRIRLAWLVKLRWAAVAGAAGLVAGAELGLDLALPRLPLAALLGLAAASNAALAGSLARGVRIGERHLGAVLTLDVGLLTGLLYWTGGPANPFSVLYLVHVALAAVMLPPAWSGALAALSVLAFGALFPTHVPIPGPLALQPGRGEGGFSLHLQGMWGAFTLAAGLIAYFVAKLSGALRAREAELAAARDREARSARLASLATLAAGTAHELGSPLGTIAVAAKELERSLARGGGDRALGEEAQLIRAEVERCRAILERMSAGAGGSVPEAPAPVEAPALLEELRAGLPPEQRPRLRGEAEPVRLRAPARALANALGSLVRNAFDASPPDAPVRVSVREEGARVRLEVCDRGHGMAPEIAERAGEPFFSTKEPGRGQGLGLFLARALAEQLGGELRLDSAPERGTRAVLELPRGGPGVPGRLGAG